MGVFCLKMKGSYMTVFHSVNPATGETLGQWPIWTDSQLRAVVDEQARHWPSLAAAPLSQRLSWLTAFSDRLVQERQTLALCMTREMGKPLAQSEAEIDKTRALIDYLCVEVPQAFATHSLTRGVARRAVALGGVLGIMPWNYPLWQLARFALPALAVGNSVTIKPAPNVWQSSVLLEQWLAEAGFPASALRLVRADIDQLPLLYDHPHLRQVHFTGSRDVGAELRENGGRAVAVARHSPRRAPGAGDMIAKGVQNPCTTPGRAVRSASRNITSS